MANIQVPLGQSLTKFPNIRRSKPEFEKGVAEKAAGSDIEFFKTLADRGRLVFSTDNTQSSTGTFGAITPQNGETFYFLGGSWQIELGLVSSGELDLRNDGIVRESISFANSNVDFRESNGLWALKFDSLIGNGTRTYDMLFTETEAAIVANASIFGYILPSETLSSRGSG